MVWNLRLKESAVLALLSMAYSASHMVRYLVRAVSAPGREPEARSCASIPELKPSLELC